LADERAVPEGCPNPSSQLDLESPEEENYARLIDRQVVVVEDDPVVAKSIELSLQAVGIRVKVFCNAEDALTAPDIMEADFYISDYILPGLDGLQLLDAIQKRSETPINAVLMTGEMSAERGKATIASCWPVLFKPAGLSSLLAIIDEALERRSRK
jgi:DNA-binding NtrC family response regulator